MEETTAFGEGARLQEAAVEALRVEAVSCRWSCKWGSSGLQMGLRAEQRWGSSELQIRR